MSGPIVFVSAILEIINPWEVLSINFESTLGRDIAFILVALVKSWSCYYLVDSKKSIIYLLPYVYDSIHALRAADENRCEFWVEPIQFCNQRGYAGKKKVTKG